MNYLKASALCAGLIALAGCQKPAEDTSKDEAVIRAAAPAFGAAVNAGDQAKLTDMYWEDATILPPNAPAVSGNTAIGEALIKMSGELKGGGLTMNIPEAGKTDISGDLAYESGVFTVTSASGETVETGKYIGVFQKRDGKWKYIRDTWNSDAPPPAPAAPAEAAPEAGTAMKAQPKKPAK